MVEQEKLICRATKDQWHFESKPIITGIGKDKKEGEKAAESKLIEKVNNKTENKPIQPKNGQNNGQNGSSKAGETAQ
jgi:hypothetical protein